MVIVKNISITAMEFKRLLSNLAREVFMATLQEALRGTRSSHQAIHWEMIASFVLSVRGDQPSGRKSTCILEPVADALEQFKLEDWFLCEVSQVVEQAGIEMRDNCPKGTLASVNVRVNVPAEVMHSSKRSDKPWMFYVIKQIASSESDNLNAFEEPLCTIDLHVYQKQ